MVGIKKTTLAQVRVKDMQIKNLRDGREQLIKRFVEDNCPYKVGDDIEVTGYSFRGKTMRIGSIYLKKGYEFFGGRPASYMFHYTGNIIKKNGDVGEQYTSFDVEIKEGKDG